MKKLKVIAMNISKKNKTFRKIARKTMFIIKRTKYNINGLNKKTNPKIVLFSCFNGKSYTCSPKAIYEYMLGDDKYKDYQFIWFFKSDEVNKYDFLNKNRNTKVVSKKSKDYEKYLHIGKYWFFNFKIADYIIPKKDQVFTQCWHGTPLKRLGFDLTHYDNQLNTVKEMRKRYKVETEKFSYFISPSAYASGVFRSAWNLKEFGKNDIIIEKGYPRNDFLFKYTENDVSEIKKRILGEDIKNKKIILYAPTYRANQHESGVGYVYKEEVDFEKMREKLGDKFIILFRPHYFVASVFNFDKYKGFVYNASDVDDINDLYSSVFFDYANLKRPIIFYMYDLDYYRDESNGFYFDVEENLPGKIVKTDDDLIDEIIRVSKEFKYDEKYKKFNEKFNYLDDGEASKRVVETVIK